MINSKFVQRIVNYALLLGWNLLCMLYWRVKSATRKLLGLQWEAHVAPHLTCASRCSLGKADSLTWVSPRGHLDDNGIGEEVLGLQREAHVAPHSTYLPTALLRCSKLCPMSTDTVEGVSVPDATNVIPQHHP